jgi:hypothetical protein
VSTVVDMLANDVELEALRMLPERPENLTPCHSPDRPKGTLIDKAKRFLSGICVSPLG